MIERWEENQDGSRTRVAVVCNEDATLAAFLADPAVPDGAKVWIRSMPVYNATHGAIFGAASYLRGEHAALVRKYPWVTTETRTTFPRPATAEEMAAYERAIDNMPDGDWRGNGD